MARSIMGRRKELRTARKKRRKTTKHKTRMVKKSRK